MPRPPLRYTNGSKMAASDKGTSVADTSVSSSSSPYGGRYDNLEWIAVNEMLSQPSEESMKAKLIRKTKENPLVPIGAVATTAALTYGLWCMQSGNARRSQLMMRARILAQGFTVGAILVGMVIAGAKSGSSNTGNS